MSEKCDDAWVGFDLGGTKMLAAVYDAAFRLRGRKRRRTRGHEGMVSGLNRIVGTIHKALEEAEVPLDRLRGIGVGCPGPLDLEDGVIREAPNLGWKDVPIRATLEREFGCPVVIANDVDAGVFGEYRCGAARTARCVLGVFPGTGIGGGCVYEGKIFRGRNTSCMEIGHMQVVPDGPLCGCGQRGCLEAVASRLAISAAAAQAAFRGQAPRLQAAAGTELAEIRSSVLADAVKGGDTVVGEIVRNAAAHIGVAVAGLIHLLAPDVVVLGGGLVEAMPELFLKTVQQTAQDRVLPSFRGTFQVVAAKLGDDATCLGAAAWAKELIEHEPRLRTIAADGKTPSATTG